MCLLNLTFYTKIVLTHWGKRYDVSVLQKRGPGTPGGRGFGGGAPIFKKKHFEDLSILLELSLLFLFTKSILFTIGRILEY